MSTPFLVAYAAAVLFAVSAVTVSPVAEASGPSGRTPNGRQALRQFEDFRELADHGPVRGRLAVRVGRKCCNSGTAALDRYGATSPGGRTGPRSPGCRPTERERLMNEVGEVAFLTGRAAGVLNRNAEVADRLKTLTDRTIGPERAGRA